MDRDRGAPPLEIGFRADSAERLTQNRAAVSAARTSGWLALLGAFLIHASILSLLILEYELGPATAPAAREIPVEIVVEQPPPKEPAPLPAKSEPTPAPRPFYEPPALDNPRADNDEKIKREAPDEATKAPGAPTTAKAPSLSPAPAQAAQTTQEHEPQAPPKSAEPLSDKAAEEQKQTVEAAAETPAEPQTPADANVQPDKLPTFVGQPFPTWSTGAQFATSNSVPDIELGSAAGPTPISGGKAQGIYLPKLRAIILSHLHSPAAFRGNSSRAEGAINFIIDGAGNLVQRQIARESGSKDLDSAALAAVGEAAPFPPPPQGLPMRLVFTYGPK